jgi:hypothetical protein
LTPLPGELRAEARASRPLEPAWPGPRSRLADWRRRRRPAQTLGGAVAFGLLKLAIGLTVGSGLALLLAHLLARPAAIGFYVLGSVVLLAALVGAQASRRRTAYEYGESGRPPRARPGLLLAAVGILLIATGAILETV